MTQILKLLICPLLKLLFLWLVHTQWYTESNPEVAIKVGERGLAKKYIQEVATNHPSSIVIKEGIHFLSLLLLTRPCREKHGLLCCALSCIRSSRLVVRKHRLSWKRILMLLLKVDKLPLDSVRQWDSQQLRGLVQNKTEIPLVIHLFC